MRQLRIALWALAVAAIAVGVFFLLNPPQQQAPTVTSRPDPDAAVSYGGDFTLTGTDGERWSSAALEGRPHALFFGFTSCPEICPTTLSDLVRARRAIGDAEAFDIVFVTVDPERDDADGMGKYLALFEDPIIGLTGTRAEIDAVMDQYGIRAEREGGGETYNVNHTASVFLFDAKGEFAGTIALEENQDVARQKLERIAAS